MQVKEIKCPKCGAITPFSGGQRLQTCKFCGSQLTLEDEKAQVGAEKIYYQKNHITVSASGLKILNTTYPLGKTTSAYKRTIPLKIPNLIVAILVGLGMVVTCIYLMLYGSCRETGDKVFLVIGAIWGLMIMNLSLYRFIARKPRFGITLATPEGEKPLSAPIFRKEQVIDEIISAINEAAREKW
jgi:hypothetical protein